MLPGFQGEDPAWHTGNEPFVHHCNRQEHGVPVGPFPSMPSERRCQAVPVSSFDGQEGEELCCLFPFLFF